jgi:hypothetical protein
MNRDQSLLERQAQLAAQQTQLAADRLANEAQLAERQAQLAAEIFNSQFQLAHRQCQLAAQEAQLANELAAEEEARLAALRQSVEDEEKSDIIWIAAIDSIEKNGRVEVIIVLYINNIHSFISANNMYLIFR